MRISRRLTVSLMLLAAVVAGCGTRPPTGPSATTNAEAGIVSSAEAAAFGPETPPFNLQAVLRPLSGSGFGLVKFRQPNDADLTVYLDVWVRDLAPNTAYSLQRAVDSVLDGECTSTSWLTLGKGLQPESITTDASGSGRDSLYRVLPSSLLGLGFDIHFRVIEDATLSPILQSDCYRFVVSQ